MRSHTLSLRVVYVFFAFELSKGDVADLALNLCTCRISAAIGIDLRASDFHREM